MNRKLVIPIVVLAILLLIPTLVRGAETVSLIYSVYNSTDATYKETGSTRESWLCKISPDVTYNTTTSGVFISYILTTNAIDGAGLDKHISLHMQSDKTQFWWCDSVGGSFQIGTEETDTYDKVEYYTVTFKNGIVNIGGKLEGEKVDYDKYVKDYAVGDIPFVPKYVAGAGSVVDVLEAGFVTFEFSSVATGVETGAFMDLIMGFIPIVVLFSLLGVMFGALKRMGKI